MLTRQIAAEAADTGVVAIAVYLGVVDTALPASIRAQPEQVVGAATARRFRRLHDENALQPPERPARLIAALAAADDLALNGRIVDIHDEKAQCLLATATP